MKNIFIILMFTCSLYSNTINGLEAKLTTNLQKYPPNASIELEASLNKDGYIYIFYVTGSDIQMIFPNEFQRESFITRDELVYFPNENIKKITAYEEDIDEDVGFFAIASEKNLPLKSLCEERSDGIYIYENGGSFETLIQKCINKKKCSKKIITFDISTDISSKNIKFTFNSKDVNPQNFINFFNKNGIKSKNSTIKIDFNIKKIIKYSQESKTTIELFQISSYLYKDGLLIETLEDECTKEDINAYLLEMYNELEKV
ncbi:DUF4384 domain-containing protein [Sulfurimonas sp.]|nr:DUF4384 domain-containing protein [Sulfurimonas sp.]